MVRQFQDAQIVLLLWALLAFLKERWDIIHVVLDDQAIAEAIGADIDGHHVLPYLRRPALPHWGSGEVRGIGLLEVWTEHALFEISAQALIFFFGYPSWNHRRFPHGARKLSSHAALEIYPRDVGCRCEDLVREAGEDLITPYTSTKRGLSRIEVIWVN
jgi:hypothetical protein